MKGAVTDLDGKYTISLDPGAYKVVASYVGYSTIAQRVTVVAGENTTLDLNMSEGVLIDEVVVTGTRASNRTNLESPVPVDVINVGELTSKSPQVTINQILHQTAPSFSSNTQTISDGTDHIDPASLRGLGPDQVLVLVNGKRRHTTSLVNVNGTFGRGNVGTDMNAIPASAISNIEILRDGAAAQYGTDAIAGVINIKLREDVNQLAVNLTTGANFTDGIGPFGGEEKSADGEVVNLGLNYGLPLGNDGGFINLTGEFNYRGKTSRMQEFTGQIFNAYNGIERVALADGADISNLTLDQIQTYAQDVSYLNGETLQELNNLTDLSGLAGVLDFDVTEEELAARNQVRSDYNMLVGQSEVRGGKFFANLSLPVGDNAELYSFAEAFLLGAAVRFENYSDFGSTFNYKLTGRYKISNNFALRAGTSTGFRAPSLHQIHFSRTSTIFNLVDGVSVPQEVGVFANTSRVAKLLGIPELKEETSTSISAGFTAKVPAASLRFTVDAYQEDGINASDLLREKGLVDTYFDQTSRIYLEQAVPRVKLTLGNTLTLDKLTIYLRNTYFGETTEATNANIFDADLNWIDKSIDPYNDAKIVTDLSLGYEVGENLNLTVGANNLLDVYPDEADPSFRSDGRFVYSRRSPQFSYGGRYLFARVAFVLK
eukprot:g437.t1